MKRKTLRKRVSKKSRKTRNKNMSKRKTRINKKHYSRKMRGGETENLSSDDSINIPQQEFVEENKYELKKGSLQNISLIYLGEDTKRAGPFSSIIKKTKNVKFFLYISPKEEDIPSRGTKIIYLHLYWMHNTDVSILNRRIRGNYTIPSYAVQQATLYIYNKDNINKEFFESMRKSKIADAIKDKVLIQIQKFLNEKLQASREATAQEE